MDTTLIINKAKKIDDTWDKLEYINGEVIESDIKTIAELKKALVKNGADKIVVNAIADDFRTKCVYGKYHIYDDGIYTSIKVENGTEKILILNTKY